MFEEIGYNIVYKKLNSKDFGVPQSRERVYIIGTLANTDISFDNIKLFSGFFSSLLFFVCEYQFDFPIAMRITLLVCTVIN